MSEKAEIRRVLLLRRDAIPPEVRRAKDRLILNNLLAVEEFLAANTILFFASFRSEVNTLPMIERVLMEGRRVFVPKVDTLSKTLHLFEIKGITELAPGYMGIPEPNPEIADRNRNIEEIDVIIIPGAGFDPAGNRIGYGGGYYDRLLSALTRKITVIAPAFEEQIEDMIPSEPHDRKVDIIVTDRRTIRTAK